MDGIQRTTLFCTTIGFLTHRQSKFRSYALNDFATYLALRKYWHIQCGPAAIRLAQMVELQVAVCTIPIAKGKYKLLPKLHAVCILSRQVQEVRNSLNKYCDMLTNDVDSGY